MRLSFADRDCKHDRLWIWFPIQKIKYFTFSFLRSGVEAKHGDEYRHNTNTKLPLPTLLHVEYNVKMVKNLRNKYKLKSKEC